MKKIVGILILATLSLGAFAQSGKLANAAGRNLDTVTNTGTKTMTSARVLQGKLSSVTVTTRNSNLTGTQSGIARLFGSPDGVNYYRIRSPQLHNSQVDSLLITTAPTAQKYGWEIDGNPYNYYQVQTTGVGTVTFTVAGEIIAHQ